MKMRSILRWSGYVLMLFGIAGWINPSLLGLHVGIFHNLVHFGVGLGLVYYSRQGSAANTRSFCMSFGLVFTILGLCGYIFGKQGSPMGVGMDPRNWRFIPGWLEYSSADHMLHLLIGLACCFAGWRT